MRYLVGTEAEINEVNVSEATLRRCNGVTTMWYATRAVTGGLACLMIDDDKNILGSTTSPPDWETP